MEWMMMPAVLIAVMSCIGYVIMGIDKSRAKKGAYRIPERTIWLIAVFGGAIGTWLGMKAFRHKTKHRSFAIGLPLLSFLTIALMIWILVTERVGI